MPPRPTAPPRNKRQNLNGHRSHPAITPSHPSAHKPKSQDPWPRPEHLPRTPTYSRKALAPASDAQHPMPPDRTPKTSKAQTPTTAAAASPTKQQKPTKTTENQTLAHTPVLTTPQEVTADTASPPATEEPVQAPPESPEILEKTAQKRLPEASPARSKGEARRPTKVPKLKLKLVPEGADESNTESDDDKQPNDCLLEYNLSPTHSPTRMNARAPPKLPLPGHAESMTTRDPSTPMSEALRTPASSEQRPPAPPYTRNAEPTQPGQNDNVVQIHDVQPRDLQGPTTAPAQPPNAPTNNLEAHGNATHLGNTYTPPLQSHETCTSIRPPHSSKKLPPHTKSQPRTKPGTTPPPPTRTQQPPPPPPNPHADTVDFTPIPEGGFPYVQLGTDPTFRLAENKKNACESKPQPKIWARLWRGEYDDSPQAQTRDILSIQRVIFQRTQEKPQILAPTRDDSTHVGGRGKHLPPHHFLVSGISKETCDRLVAERVVSTPQAQVFFIPYNPGNPSYICTIKGFLFDTATDESSPNSDVDPDAEVQRIVQESLRNDQSFKSIIRARCTARHPPEVFIQAIRVVRHEASLPKPKGSPPNAPHPKESQWHLYFNTTPPLQRTGFYALTSFFAQKEYEDLEWGNGGPLPPSEVYHCVCCKAADHVSSDCPYLMVPGWHGIAPEDDGHPPSLEAALAKGAPRGRASRRGGNGGGGRGRGSNRGARGGNMYRPR
ncbi:hypothetical protein H0H92_004585 [Tricholoma furcatifolium]|nr:hypothetical protein H0H92_004585 [Tricholoma furcatifolium]